jgi:uncharacterized protein HemY
MCSYTHSFTDTLVACIITLGCLYAFFWVVHGVCSLYASVSEHPVCSIFIGR